MSKKTEEINNSILDLKLTEQELHSVPKLIEGTEFPVDFLNTLNNTDTIANDRKLVVMYHFAQGHMHGTIMEFMTSELPHRMNVEDGPVA